MRSWLINKNICLMYELRKLIWKRLARELALLVESKIKREEVIYDAGYLKRY